MHQTMAMNAFSFQSIHQQNQSLNSFLFPLEFDSLYERGPRYKAYSDLRESKLRLKSTQKTYQETYEEEQDDFVAEPSILTPKKDALPKRSKGSSVLAQSVPDFSAVMRKENRKPCWQLPPVGEKAATPPLGSKNGRGCGVGGSKSVNSSGEKRRGSMMARKSYASMEELKGLGSIARNGIIGENKVGVTTRASSRNVFRYARQF